MLFFVYILASKPHGTLKAVPGFTAKYSVDRLVWFEAHESMAAAAQRERQIKEWRRAWKIQLIEQNNPHWIDLYPAYRHSL
jgi:putative endonuclease